MQFSPDIRPAAPLNINRENAALLNTIDREGKGRIRIVLVEDHAILREGLKALIEIEPDFDIVGEFGSVEDCLAGIADLRPDLLLTDLALPGRSGIELLAEIQRLSPLTRKLVLTAHENEEYIRAALNAGGGMS